MPSGPVLTGIGQQAAASVFATGACTERDADAEGSAVVKETPVGVDGKRSSAQKIRQQELPRPLSPQQVAAGLTGRLGSSTPVRDVRRANAASWPQKITARDRVIAADHWLKGGQSLGHHDVAVQGSCTMLWHFDTMSAVAR
jgi:hypothetical protein